MDNAQSIMQTTSWRDNEYVVDTYNTLWRFCWQKRTLEPLMHDVRWADGNLIITKDGGLWSWGNNQHGEVGDGTRIDRTAPVRILENVRAAHQIYGWDGGHRMAITEEGALYAWGRNYNGQLRDGTNEDRDIPTRVLENVYKMVLMVTT